MRSYSTQSGATGPLHKKRASNRPIIPTHLRFKFLLFFLVFLLIVFLVFLVFPVVFPERPASFSALIQFLIPENVAFASSFPRSLEYKLYDFTHSGRVLTCFLVKYPSLFELTVLEPTLLEPTEAEAEPEPEIGIGFVAV